MSLPTVKLEQRIVVGVEVPRQAVGDLVADDEAVEAHVIYSLSSLRAGLTSQSPDLNGG